VAVLATVPIAILPATSELDVVRLLLAGVVAAVGFAVARAAGAGTPGRRSTRLRSSSSRSPSPS